MLILYAIKSNALYICNSDKYSNSYSIFWFDLEDISIKQSIEIIIMNILSKFILKNKYFIHHYLSIILFCLSSIGFDLFLSGYRFSGIY